METIDIFPETPIRQLAATDRDEAVRMAREQLECALTAGRFLVSFHRVVGDQLHHDWTMFDFPDGDMKNCVAALRAGCARSLREKAVSVMGQKTNVDLETQFKGETASVRIDQPLKLTYPPPSPPTDDEECSESVPSAGGQPPRPPEMLRPPLDPPLGRPLGPLLGDIDEAE